MFDTIAESDLSNVNKKEINKINKMKRKSDKLFS